LFERDKRYEDEVFKATFWHETMHNLGYSHLDDGPDRAFFCQAACFGKAYRLDKDTIDGAWDQCESKISGTSTYGELEYIKRVIIGYSR
jgi:hypothetical protein